MKACGSSVVGRALERLALLCSERNLGRVERQALAWTRKVASGGMTRADAAALKAWCGSDPARAQAFMHARAQWRNLGVAGHDLVARQPSVLLGGMPGSRPAPGERPLAGRRMFIGGSAAMLAGGAGVALVHPPLDLWPSLTEVGADFRTAVGEQRNIVLATDVAVQMNTRTSLSLRDFNGRAGIELLVGEAAIHAPARQQPFVLKAGAGRVLARDARFEVRQVDDGVCVSCVAGVIEVSHPGGTRVVHASQQVVYTGATLGATGTFDPAMLSAWREGFLRFAGEPLGDVVQEINRYRRGRVVLMDKSMAGRPVTGRFRIDALDVAVLQIRNSFGLQARTLPGGLLLLS